VSMSMDASLGGLVAAREVYTKAEHGTSCLPDCAFGIGGRLCPVRAQAPGRFSSASQSQRTLMSGTDLGRSRDQGADRLSLRPKALCVVRSPGTRLGDPSRSALCPDPHRSVSFSGPAQEAAYVSCVVDQAAPANHLTGDPDGAACPGSCGRPLIPAHPCWIPRKDV
jgi:hypothetical protein